MTLTIKTARAALTLGILSFLTGQAVLAAEQTPAPAEDKSPWSLSGSVSFTTDYLFRGISQTDNDPAGQGLLEVGYAAHDLFAPYLSIWGSNVDFGSPEVSDKASLELDFTSGFRGSYKLNDNYALLYDLNATYYFYPDTVDRLQYNFVDFGPTLQLKTPWFTPGVTYRYSPDNFADSGNAHYLYGTLAVPIPITALTDKFELAANGRIGRQWVQHNTAFGLPDYNEWNAGLTLTYVPWAVDLNVQYADTDVSRAECGGLSNCGGRGVVTLTKRF